MSNTVTGPDQVPVIFVGGTKTQPVAAASTWNHTNPGALVSVLVTTAGTAALNLYDTNSGSATGTIIGAIPASATVGQLFTFNMPAALGIYAAGGAGTPAVTVNYI